MIDEPCKLFVAAYTQTYAIIVFAEPSIVNECIGLMGPLVADVLGDQRPPADGLWMFDGRVISVMPDDTPRFTGVWRRPTDVEAIAAAAGENPCLETC